MTAAMTARVALELDMVQYDKHDGPCLTTFRTLRALRLDTAEPGDAFPHFTREAQLRGITGVMSIPALWAGDLVATLNLYSRRGPFDETALTVASVLWAQVSIAVSRSPEFAAARSVVEQGQRDVDHDSEVKMATGLLVVSQECTIEQAEALLESAAAEDDKTVVEIARRIIDQHRRSR